MLSLKPEERRRAPRHHLGRVAAIIFGPGAEQHYCLVTDVSEGGVRLNVKELSAAVKKLARCFWKRPSDRSTFEGI
jgi:hypothetical protein